MTPKEREALRLALEALEGCEDVTADVLKAITAIKAALEAHKALMSVSDGAQPAVAEQHKQITTCGEPVAVVDANDEGYWADILPDQNVKVGQFLYTTPPQRPSRSDIKPLTDEQVREIANQYALSLAFPYDSPTTPEMFARAIEAAHGIKE